MLAIVNRRLFSQDSIVTNYTNREGKYLKTKLFSSNQVYRESINIDNQKPITITTGAYVYTQEIAKISSDIISESNISVNTDFDKPARIFVSDDNEKKERIVDIRLNTSCANTNNVYIVAFPFNGMMEAINKDIRYMIHKGFIVTSSSSFYFEGRKYRKILYLVMETLSTNKKPINIKFKSYGLYTDKDSGNQRTNCEVMNLTIYPNIIDNKKYDIRWEYSDEDRAIIIPYSDNDINPLFELSEIVDYSQEFILNRQHNLPFKR